MNYLKFKTSFVSDDDGTFWPGVIEVPAETEIKYAWEGEWPTHWIDVRIPYRKQKLLDRIDKNLTFYVLRSDLKETWVIPDFTIKKYAVIKEMPNRYVPKGEKFFFIPADKIHKVLLSK